MTEYYLDIISIGRIGKSGTLVGLIREEYFSIVPSYIYILFLLLFLFLFMLKWFYGFSNVLITRILHIRYNWRQCK